VQSLFSSKQDKILKLGTLKEYVLIDDTFLKKERKMKKK